MKRWARQQNIEREENWGFQVKIWGFGHENALSTINAHTKSVSGLTVNDGKLTNDDVIDDTLQMVISSPDLEILLWGNGIRKRASKWPWIIGVEIWWVPSGRADYGRWISISRSLTWSSMQQRRLSRNPPRTRALSEIYDLWSFRIFAIHRLWDERDLSLIAEFPKKNNIQVSTSLTQAIVICVLL